MPKARESQVFLPVLEDVVAYIDEGVIIADAEGGIIFQNPAAVRLLRQPSDNPMDNLSQMPGFNFRSSYLKAAINMGEVDAAGRPSGRYVTFEETLTLDGVRRIQEFTIGMAAAGRETIWLVLIRDRTDQRRLEEVLDPESSLLKTDDPQMKATFDLIHQAAPSGAAVLLQGESGTGKTELARLIQRLSNRTAGPFVELNCAAIPDSLLESELFGHKKGAFTGATSDRQGRFQSANGGTLFLDEVGEIPLHLQPKLLRAIEDQEFEMVGSDRPVRVDVRIMAASNQPLRDMVDQGTFRPDLYYRLAVIPLSVPPLRERPGDIQTLVNHFCQELTEAAHRSEEAKDCFMTRQAMQMLLEYPWPGNIRELRNAVEHGIICASGATIQPSDLPHDIQAYNGFQQKVSGDGSGTIEDEQQRQKRELQDALRQANGSRSMAAHILGIDRSTLWRRMQRVGVQ